MDNERPVDVARHFEESFPGCKLNIPLIRGKMDTDLTFWAKRQAGPVLQNEAPRLRNPCRGVQVSPSKIWHDQHRCCCRGGYCGQGGQSRPRRHFFAPGPANGRSEEHTSELQSLMRIPYAAFCLQKTKQHTTK